MLDKIITLPDHLANQIAAGEVVERPISVVKELVENSIDAGATHIQISLNNGGIDLIEVNDNGSGITSGDLLKSVKKYSTSKITSLDDLHRVLTFGFRGEALASISSVSSFTITSCTDENKGGSMIHSDDGKSFTQESVAHEIGTSVRVENLFHNTPARLNYLKKPRTEYLKVLEFIQKISLIYPEIAFTLRHDEKQVLNFPAQQRVEERIYQIYGAEFGENILSVNHEFSGVSVTAMISNPKVSFPNKNRQSIFVNKRIVQSPMISKAIHDAYNRFIPHGNFPAYVVSIELDPTFVDVNVHPRKMEVRFAEESSIFRSVYHGIKNELEKVSLIDGAKLSEIKTETLQTSIGNEVSTAQYYTGSGTKFKNYSPYTNLESHPQQSSFDLKNPFPSQKSKESSYEVRDFNKDLHETPLGRIIGQIHNSYIVIQTHEGMQILDQHALAERVIYEKLAHKAYTPKKQSLLGGIGVHITIQELENLESYMKDFLDMGFDIDVLSQGNIIIQSIPDFIQKQNIETVFKKILSDISDIGSKGLDDVRHRIWAFTACRSAIKFGDPLSLFEMNKLLCDASTEYSSTCPHGRPVIYSVSLEELQKKYER